MEADKKTRNKEAAVYWDLGLYAFGGLGLEIVLLMLEQFFYGINAGEWTLMQRISHWIFTCIVWGITSWRLLYVARKKHGFDFWKAGEKQIALWRYLAAAALWAVCVAISYVEWNGFKMIQEFAKKTPVEYLFQYIYYIFEVVLVFLVIVFGQRAGEIRFGKRNIPWGGLYVGLTWGLVHALTKGNLAAGLGTCLEGILFGTAFLLLGRKPVAAYAVILCMFIM